MRRQTRFGGIVAAGLVATSLVGCVGTGGDAAQDSASTAATATAAPDLAPTPTSTPVPTDHATGTWRSAAGTTSGTVDVVIHDDGWLTLELRDFATDAAPTFGGIYAAIIVDSVEEGSTCFGPSLAMASPEIQAAGDQDVGLTPIEHLPPIAPLDSYVTAAIYTVPETVDDREPGCDGYTLEGYAPLTWSA
ncbi:hypothetical protein DVJ78_07320 [Humibacter sp. BT305]|nr:hypothetical protein DVJ78_07320 [Humibacter sp. BT305]